MIFTVYVSGEVQAPLVATNGFGGTLRKRPSPLVNRPLPLDHVFPSIVRRVSPAVVRTMTVGEGELKSNEIALMSRSFSENSNHLPAMLTEMGEVAEPAGILTFRLVSRASSWRRAAGFSGRRPGFIAGSSLSQTRFMTCCMLRTPLVIATTASSSGITMQNWPNAPSPRKEL